MLFCPGGEGGLGFKGVGFRVYLACLVWVSCTHEPKVPLHIRTCNEICCINIYFDTVAGGGPAPPRA